MSSIRKFAEQLNLSTFTISAALRGPPRVGACPRGETIVVLRVRSNTCRGRVAVARHRVIVQAARKAAQKLNYRLETIVLGIDELARLPGIMGMHNYVGLIVLPGPDIDLLRRIYRPYRRRGTGQPPPRCIYVDSAPDELFVDSIGPDYNQAVLLALNRLRSVGIKTPGLMLDCDLPVPTRVRLITAYSHNQSRKGCGSPPPFFTPTRRGDAFDRWLGRNAFDGLLATDTEAARRLAWGYDLPIFGINADASTGTPGIDLNLSEVGRTAIEILHGRNVGARHSALMTRTLISASWTTEDDAILSPVSRAV